MRAGANDSGPTENEPGTGPATSASPSIPANKSQKEEKEKEERFLPLKLSQAANELTHRDLSPADVISIEEEDSPDSEVLKVFRQKIQGLRRLPRDQRVQARRAALEWLRSTMAGLREKRLYGRQARRWQREHRQSPRPRL